MPVLDQSVVGVIYQGINGGPGGTEGDFAAWTSQNRGCVVSFAEQEWQKARTLFNLKYRACDIKCALNFYRKCVFHRVTSSHSQRNLVVNAFLEIWEDHVEKLSILARQVDEELLETRSALFDLIGDISHLDISFDEYAAEFNSKLECKYFKLLCNLLGERIYINLSDGVLSRELSSILSKGLRFEVIPATIPIEEIICSVEVTLRTLPKLSKVDCENARRSIANILRRAGRPQTNIPHRDLQSLSNLKVRQNIVIVPRQSNYNFYAAMNTSTYNSNMVDSIRENNFKKLKYDPAPGLAEKLMQFIAEQELPKSLQAWAAKPPRLYGFVDDDSDGNNLLTLYVNFKDSIFEKFCCYLMEVLKPYCNTNRYVTNARELSSILENANIEKGSHFEVVKFTTKMFTHGFISIKFIFELMTKLNIPKNIKHLLRFSFQSAFYLFNGKYYKHKNKLLLSKTIGRLLFNLFATVMEEDLYSNNHTRNFRPYFWSRNSNEIVAIVSKNKLEALYKFVNEYDDYIRFEKFIEPNTEFTICNIPVTLKSNKIIVKNPKSYKGRVFLPWIPDVTDKIKQILDVNCQIDTVYKKKKIASYLPFLQDKLSPVKYSGVFRVYCGCRSFYVGQTEKSIQSRVPELMREAAIIKHNCGSLFNLLDINVVDDTTSKNHQIIRKSIEIAKARHLCVNRNCCRKLSPIWLDLIQHEFQ